MYEFIEVATQIEWPNGGAEEGGERCEGSGGCNYSLTQYKHEVKLKIQRSYEEMVKEGGGIELRRENSLVAGIKGELSSNLFKNEDG